MRSPFLAAFILLASVGMFPARAADVDPYLPDDTEAVLTVNVRQILEAPFIKKNAAAGLKNLLGDALIGKHLKDLDLDPQKDLDSLVLTNSGGDPDRSLLIVHGRFEVAKFEAKADELARSQPKSWKITKIPDGKGGQYKVLESTRWFDLSSGRPRTKEQPAYLALLDKRVLIGSPAKDLLIDALDKAKGSKKGTLKSKELKGLLEKANGKQSIWIALLPKAVGKLIPDDDDSPVRDELDKIEAISGGITVDDEVKLELALSVKDADVAKELSTEINEGLNILLTVAALASHEKKEWQPVLDGLKTVKATCKSNTIILKGALTAEMLEKAMKK